MRLFPSVCLLVVTVAAQAQTLYVAPTGKDAWPGTASQPFATVQRARDAARQLPKPVVIELAGGTYRLERPLELTGADSHVTYRARRDASVRLSGGQLVTNWQPATNRIRQANLRELGITDFGPVQNGGLELFFRDEPMTLARWPNQGFVRVVDVVEHDGHQIHGKKGSKTGKFIYDGSPAGKIGFRQFSVEQVGPRK